jgi:hypothetical protein
MNPMWSTDNQGNANRVFISQKKIIKIILFSVRLFPLPLINDLHLTLTAIKIKRDLIKNIMANRYVRGG